MYFTMTQIKQANRDKGHHWFDPSTLRFFRSRFGKRVYGARYFVSSEQGPGMPRRYSVRIAHDDGRVCTVGEFNSMTRSEAHTFARKAARDSLPCQYDHKED